MRNKAKVKDLHLQIKELQKQLNELKRKTSIIEEPTPYDPSINIPSGVELQCAGDPGITGRALRSQGSGNNPIWGDIVGGLYGLNVETLTADKTLTVDTDPIHQYLDPGITNRVITLSTTGAKVGDRFIIRHNGAYNSAYYLQVQQGATILDKVYAGVIKEFIFDGTNWISKGIGTGENDTKRRQVGIGEGANPHSYGTALGYSADGYDFGTGIGSTAQGYNYGVAIGYGANGLSKGVGVGYLADGDYDGVGIGYQADGYSRGVGVGYYADGSSRGVAIGYYAGTGGKSLSTAMGYYSRCTRVAETAINIDGDSSYLRQVTQGRWVRQTVDETPTELFCGGVVGERFTIRPKSAVAFTGLVVASTEAVAGTPNVTKAWKVEGLIKRDANGVTSIVGTVSITVIAEDTGAAGWTITVDADDTNEALRIQATGAPATTIWWAAWMDCVEVVW